VDDQGIDFHKGSFGDVKRLKVINLQLASDRCPDKNHDIIIERKQTFAGRLVVFEKFYDNQMSEGTKPSWGAITSIWSFKLLSLSSFTSRP